MATPAAMMGAPWQAGILTISDSRCQGRCEDTATPRIRRLLEQEGFAVQEAALVPDDRQQIQARLVDFADRLGLSLVVTTGGTGFGPRDVTPEATRGIMEREVPGLPEAMRMRTARHNPLAWLSRATAGLRGRTLIVNLPGNPRGAEECLRVVLPLLPHALEMVEGEPHRTGFINPRGCAGPRCEARKARGAWRTRPAGTRATSNAAGRRRSAQPAVSRGVAAAGPVARVAPPRRSAATTPSSSRLGHEARARATRLARIYETGSRHGTRVAAHS